MKKRLNRGFSFTAYALLIGIMVAVILSMHIFMVRTFQAKFRQAADTFGAGEQYERGVTEVVNEY